MMVQEGNLVGTGKKILLLSVLVLMSSLHLN